MAGAAHGSIRDVATVINLDRFRRYRPPPPPAVEEPTAEDIEAALRIKILEEELRGLRLRNRIADDFLFRRCLRGLLFWGTVLFFLVQCSRGAPADEARAKDMPEELLGTWCDPKPIDYLAFERRPCGSEPWAASGG